MDAVLADIGQLIETHRAWAGPIVAAIAFAESLVLVGLLMPATALMLLLGGLVGSGVVGPVPVLVGAIIGAILGDIVSYVIGRWLGPGIVHRRPLRRYRPAVAKTRLFFRKYGFAAVVIGRFLGPIRSTVPLVAGMMRMDHTRFQVANVLSAILWAPLVMAPGWLGARGMAGFDGLGGVHVLALLAVVLAATAIATVLGGRHLGRRRERPQRRDAASKT
ncbi:DedA family protein [Aureimonas sp. AU12]|uniref:DedA family protein n=1 Tax=Aureimonas sp. AU12 TaxID=1638161 RepID=UPI000782D724|nr:DedA family protein [Aureimonas sp. AU12]